MCERFRLALIVVGLTLLIMWAARLGVGLVRSLQP